MWQFIIIFDNIIIISAMFSIIYGRYKFILYVPVSKISDSHIICLGKYISAKICDRHIWQTDGLLPSFTDNNKKSIFKIIKNFILLNLKKFLQRDKFNKKDEFNFNAFSKIKCLSRKVEIISIKWVINCLIKSIQFEDLY